jgi:hypothetical protein
MELLAGRAARRYSPTRCPHCLSAGSPERVFQFSIARCSAGSGSSAAAASGERAGKRLELVGRAIKITITHGAGPNRNAVRRTRTFDPLTQSRSGPVRPLLAQTTLGHGHQQDGVVRLCLFSRPVRETGDPGFEPGLTDPESVVLPLHQSPKPIRPMIRRPLGAVMPRRRHARLSPCHAIWLFFPARSTPPPWATST